MQNQFSVVQKCHPIGKPDAIISVCIKKCDSGAHAVEMLSFVRKAYKKAGTYDETLTSSPDPLRCRARFISEDGLVYRVFIVAPEGAHVEWKRLPEVCIAKAVAQIMRDRARFERLSRSKKGLLA